MQDDDLNKFANQFINLWQENFSKAIADKKIIEYMMQAAGNMQQFYDKNTFTEQFAAANAFAPAAGNDELYRRQLLGRIDELEQRVRSLEAKLAEASGSNKKRKPKQTV